MFSTFQILCISASRGMGLTLFCTLAGFCLLCSSCTFMQNRLAENLKNSDLVRLFRYFRSKSSETFKKRFTPLFESFTRCQNNGHPIRDGRCFLFRKGDGFEQSNPTVRRTVGRRRPCRRSLDFASGKMQTNTQQRPLTTAAIRGDFLWNLLE